MGPENAIYFGQSTVMLTFWLSMPIITAATAVGLIIALLQTLIQLQEQTLGFAAKLATVVVTFFISGGWMANELTKFTLQLFDAIATGR